jgi:2,3-diphosphopglycerate-independent phosphoglycerate mutase
LKDNLLLVNCKAEDQNDKNAVFTADLINKVSDEITKALISHPISVQRKSEGKTYPNLVLLRGAG